MSNKKVESFSQCRFVEERNDSVRVETTAYVDASHARVGARMTLKGGRGDLEGGAGRRARTATETRRRDGLRVLDKFDFYINTRK